MSSPAAHRAGPPQGGAATTPRGEGPRKGPVRTCVGCGEQVDTGTEGAAPLVRLVLPPAAGEPAPAADAGAAVMIAVDLKGGGFGRGAHVHPRPECIARAATAGLARAARRGDLAVVSGEGSAPLAPASLAAAIRAAGEQRVTGLLSSAVRAREVVVGADAVSDACRAGEAALVIVATDAAAAADLGEVRRAVAAGRAVAYGDKQSLGAACRRGDVGVVAIRSASLAHAIQETVALVDACDPASAAAAKADRAGGRSKKGRRGALAAQ